MIKLQSKPCSWLMGSYLHSLEQEVASLRAQVAALTSGDQIGQTKREIASVASRAIQSFTRDGILIDPALTDSPLEPVTRSPWDSPRRVSEYPFPPSPFDGPKSPLAAMRPHPTGQPGSVHATSLTRMVHDAALRTGHASKDASTLVPSSNSDRGSSVMGNGSPAGGEDATSPDHVATPQSAPNGIKPPVSPVSQGSKGKRAFAIPPLPPQPAVERLVAAYVDFVGVSAPMIHIPSLGKQLTKIRENHDVEQSDVFVVMMVLGQSSSGENDHPLTSQRSAPWPHPVSWTRRTS